MSIAVEGYRSKMANNVVKGQQTEQKNYLSVDLSPVSADLSVCEAYLLELNHLLQSMEVLHRTYSAPSIQALQVCFALHGNLGHFKLGSRKFWTTIDRLGPQPQHGLQWLNYNR